ncbi:endo-1,3-beta glucanase [Sporothrix stenoceras]|uniref:Endo-1,3-beta glucanase n=1 Tax=Sporothrix stenoceras TaxID=5173 RepID=A0ABR3Z7V9_9PEZI
MTDAASADAANNGGPAGTAVAHVTATTSTATAAPTPPMKLYAQYCFHLSPTLNAWCPMRVADIVHLDQYVEFEGQNVFFHMNHPIKWVRIAGVVVACNEYHARKVYTVDDGSGETIECVYDPPRPSRQQQQPPPPTMPTIMSGSIISVKGELKTYRGDLQAHIIKMTVLRSTEQEVQFWAKTAAFARETLYKPWVVDRKIVRQCRQAAEAVQRAKDEEEVRREMQQEKEERERKEKEEQERADRLKHREQTMDDLWEEEMYEKDIDWSKIGPFSVHDGIDIQEQ